MVLEEFALHYFLGSQMRKKWPISRAINFRAFVLRIINGAQKFNAIRYLISQWKTAENSRNVYIVVYER